MNFSLRFAFSFQLFFFARVCKCVRVNILYLVLHQKQNKSQPTQLNQPTNKIYVEIFIFSVYFFICLLFHFFLFISLLQILMPDKEKAKLVATVTEKRKADDIEIKDLKKVTDKHTLFLQFFLSLHIYHKI